MSEYVFDDEPDLGKVVAGVKPFCKLNKKMDIPDWKDIVGDFNDKSKPGMVGKKFSRLCGFSFRSTDPNLPPFYIVYVPKLKGPLTRNNHGLHGWYCWMQLPGNDRSVVSIMGMNGKFHFDVNKFFHSDYFEKYLPIFKSNIQYALDHQVKELIEQMDGQDEQKELIRYVDAIKDSLSKIDEVQQITTPENKYDDSNAPEYARGSTSKVGHAKIAYNADKTYALKDLDKKHRNYRRPKEA